MELFRSAISFKRISCLVSQAEHMAEPRKDRGASSTSATKTALIVAYACSASDPERTQKPQALYAFETRR
jgi:hypothetical protein